MSTVAISALVPRRRSTVMGSIVGVMPQVKPWVRLDVELNDGSGSLTLRLTGRRQIAGMSIGRGLVADGTPALVHGQTIVLNPIYSFVTCRDP